MIKAWIDQLEQIHSVSRPIAEAIARHYPTPRSLFDIYLSDSFTERTLNIHIYTYIKRRERERERD
jgi:hypothetical protein